VAKPTVFVGSSREGLEVARAVQFQLKSDAFVIVWNEGVFGLSEGSLESLVAALDRFDFAVLVITPDDLLASHDTVIQAPRDNVMFEIGLFMGRLGRARLLISLAVIHVARAVAIRAAIPASIIASRKPDVFHQVVHLAHAWRTQSYWWAPPGKSYFFNIPIHQ
jgi:hypothetical protein